MQPINIQYSTSNQKKDSAPYIITVILNWNGTEDTIECIKSLESSDYSNHDIILVDNGSSTVSVDKLKKKLPHIELIENKRNLGYAEGNNVGIRHAIKKNPDYIFILNNDTIISPCTLSKLSHAALMHPEAGMLSPIIYYYANPDTIWYAGGNWAHAGHFFYHESLGKIDDEALRRDAIITDYASGCALFISTSVIKEIGVMDPKFFLTYEETDWCYRARKAGYLSLVIPEAKVWHKVSASFGGELTPLHSYFYTRNILLWGERHLPKRDFLKLLRKTCSSVFTFFLEIPKSYLSLKSMYWSSIHCLSSIRLGSENPHARARFLGLRDYVLRRFGDCPEEVRLLK